MSFEDFRKNISYIFLDTSHGIYTMEEKWSMYLEQLQEQGQDYLMYLLWSVAIMIIWYLGYRVSIRTHRRQMVERERVIKSAGTAILMVLLLIGILMQVDAIYETLFEDKNQFYLQVRYIVLLLPAIALGVRYRRRMGIWLYLCVIPGFMSVPAVLLVTNMDTNVTYAKAFIGVLGSFLIFYQYGKETIVLRKG